MISACRSDEQRLESEVRAAIAAGDIPALTTRAYQPVAVRILSPYSRAFVDLLTGGPVLPLRVMRGLQLGETHRTHTKAQTIRRLRAATGRNAEIIRGLLTGEGDPAAVTLRRLAEAVRAVPLDVYDLSEAATRETVSFEARSESGKRAAVTRAERNKGSAKSGGTSVTRAERTAAAIAKRSARQLERDAESQRRLAARTERNRRRREARKRLKTPAELCGYDADELSERIDYRESVRRGER
jgi:hypothetical protein